MCGIDSIDAIDYPSNLSIMSTSLSVRMVDQTLDPPCS